MGGKLQGPLSEPLSRIYSIFFSSFTYQVIALTGMGKQRFQGEKARKKQGILTPFSKSH